MLTPHCSAASGLVAPSSIASTTRLRKSSEYGFAIHAGLLPAGSLNHIRAAMGIPDSAFSGNALMSATPHNGSDADFQLFMGLLDADRFEGRPREGARKVDLSDLMRRITKEELRKFDGATMSPERTAS